MDSHAGQSIGVRVNKGKGGKGLLPVVKVAELLAYLKGIAVAAEAGLAEAARKDHDWAVAEPILVTTENGLAWAEPNG